MNPRFQTVGHGPPLTPQVPPCPKPSIARSPARSLTHSDSARVGRGDCGPDTCPHTCALCTRHRRALLSWSFQSSREADAGRMILRAREESVQGALGRGAWPARAESSRAQPGLWGQGPCPGEVAFDHTLSSSDFRPPGANWTLMCHHAQRRRPLTDTRPPPGWYPPGT